MDNRFGNPRWAMMLITVLAWFRPGSTVLPYAESIVSESQDGCRRNRLLFQFFYHSHQSFSSARDDFSSPSSAFKGKLFLQSTFGSDGNRDLYIRRRSGLFARFAPTLGTHR